MKITLTAVTVIAGLIVCGTANAAVVKFKATLNGAQETPPIDTTSTGTADLDFDDAANTLSGSAEVTLANPADVDAAHIHLAECGKAGSILKGLTLNKDSFNGTIVVDSFALDADSVKALNEGRLYLNVHTKTNGGGEIRGQIYKEGSADVCPKGGAGGDGGSTTTPTDGGGNTSSSSGGTGDAGTSSGSSDDGGCSTSGGSSDASNGMLLVAGIAVAAGAVSRRRQKKNPRS
jgi:MYXO-CTERM domain-containing protein